MSKTFYKYEVILYWSEPDQAFIAEVPELAACQSDGKALVEALQNVKKIICGWMGTAQEFGRLISVSIGRLRYA